MNLIDKILHFVLDNLALLLLILFLSYFIYKIVILIKIKIMGPVLISKFR